MPGERCLSTGRPVAYAVPQVSTFDAPARGYREHERDYSVDPMRRPLTMNEKLGDEGVVVVSKEPMTSEP